VGKQILIELVEKYIPEQADNFVDLILSHPDVPIRGVFEAIVTADKKIDTSDLEALNDLMHYFG